MEKRTHISMFTLDEVLDWEYCPLCGSELFEVYLGDFAGHTTCKNDECDDTGFYTGVYKDGEIRHTSPSKKLYW